MNRIFAAVLVLSLALCAGSTSSAQGFAGADGSFGGPYVEHYPGYAYGPPGNRWAAYFANPYSMPIYPVEPAYQVAPEETRVYTRGYDQAPAPYRRALRRGWATLPNGMPSAASVPLLRDQSRGWGYGIGPYGTNYYSGMYKGLVIP